ncbi:histidine kinase [Gillisia sp. M10.2A]|uniref:Histidine kinase n=1 Tax=Gillisia lutea TaxID=2909668 RepID=A0ABS9ED56_9FLAO|nr:triple tyrosine motif-containing protein [Gillisia lutea]MCF4100796.1 histidine kinase [Gillisia lutea]
MSKLIFFFFLLIPLLGYSQDMPPVVNFNATQYAAGNQNWMIAQGVDKDIYIANGSGLLEYTGEKWSLYAVPNNTVVRSVKVSGERIYTGAYMEVGYWKKDDLGVLNYTSLLSQFPNKLEDGEQFWHIETLSDYVIFQSFEGLYIYDEGANSISIAQLSTNNPIINLFKEEQKIYFQVASEGLFTIENAQPKLVIPHKFLENIELLSLQRRNAELKLVTQDGNFYSWNGEQLTREYIELTNSLKGKSIFSSLHLENGNMILGTVSDGIYQIDQNGIILNHFNQQNGLQNNTILSLFQDNSNNVWAGLDNGLSLINLDSPFSIYEDSNGKIGSVYCSYQSKEYLYLGTNQGLYYRKKGNNNFELVAGTNGQVWNIQELDGSLLCGHNYGTFLVEGVKATKIADRSGTWIIKKVEGNSEIYVQGHYNGVSFLKRTKAGFEVLPMLKDFPHSSKFIISKFNNEFWIGNEHKGIYRIELDDSFQNILSIKNYPLNHISGITSSIFTFNDTLYYASKNVLLQYNSVSDSFQENSRLAMLLKDVNRISGKIINENDYKIWGFANNSIFNITKEPLNSSYVLNNLYLPKDWRTIPSGYENISKLDKGEYLLGIANGFLKLHKPSNQNSAYSIRIDEIRNFKIDEDSKLVSLTQPPKFHYKENNFSFSFSTPVYKKFITPLYSYRLIGLSDKWTSWSEIPEASFKNLSYGSYTFEIRNMIGKELSSAASYSFIINRPFYLSYWAFLVYLVLLALIMLIIHRLYKKHHQKLGEERERDLRLQNMEAEQKIIKLQNEQLEKDMAGKNRELAASAMSLIKKNEFLISIKEILKLSESTKAKAVIKTIDKDISEKDNWNFFKKAFNNADKDFFKKVKAIHPDLTSNDLKLCAYLRLNLSSKEIAPLLNISVKSVEIKRYRLRKKMDLDRDVNLTDYILEL